MSQLLALRASRRATRTTGRPAPRRRSARALASMSQTAASVSPSTAAIASKWFLLMRPQPTRPMRNDRSRHAVIAVSVACRSARCRRRAARSVVPHAVAGADAAVRQPLAALAHPADAPRRHAGHQRVRQHVLRDDGARADERVLAERRRRRRSSRWRRSTRRASRACAGTRSSATRGCAD